jgi:quercetin dioxygenase-like cupin family protein
MISRHSKGGTMRALALAVLALSTVGAAGRDAPATAVEVREILSTTVTAGGQPIVLPTGTVRLIASTYVIPKDVALPVHKHPFARYAYVLAGRLTVTDDENGREFAYGPGDLVVELIGRWHSGRNTGDEPVRLLVIDQVPDGEKSTILRAP